jgi:hypothetical protein
MLQTPVQQSPLAAQASPGCTQKEEGWQLPPEQKPEQQAALDVQVLPMVLHFVFSAVHLPPPHVRLQHCPFAVQARPSD